MVDEAEIHRLANSADMKERIKAVCQLRDNFASFSDKDAAWSDFHRLTQDADSFVRLMAASALRYAFSDIHDKDTAWSDLIRLTRDENEDTRSIAVSGLAPVFSDIHDKDTAWSDLIQLTQDENEDTQSTAAYALTRVFQHVPNKDAAWSDLIRLIQDEIENTRLMAAYALGSAFLHLPDKDTAWSDLHRLTQDENEDMRSIAAYALGSAFLHLPDKDTAWSDLIRLTNDGNKEVRRDAASVLSYAFLYISDKDTAWSDLHQLTLNGDKEVRMYAYHSLGSASVYKATETEDEDKFRDELKKAIDYFENSSRESVDGSYNPARFCLPFYRSYYAIISKQQEAEAEATKYLDEAKNAAGGSESKEILLKAVENLANALKEAQKPLDFGETQEHLRACRQYCDHTAELADSTRGKSPVAAAAIMRGIPIVGVKVKEIIAEIQEMANEACQELQGTSKEEIACAVNKEVQKWRVDDQEDMTWNIEKLILILKSKIPQIPQNEHIHEKIEKLREEYDMVKQYDMVLLIIALMPDKSVHIGDNVTISDVTVGDNSQIIGKGNDNRNDSDNAPTSKKSLIKWINSPATIAAFIGFLCAEIGTYFYPVTYNHLISVGIASLVFIIVAIFNKE